MTCRLTMLKMFLALCAGMLWAAHCPAETDAAAAKKSDGLWGRVSSWRLPETVQIHGFASQSYIHTSGNEFFGHSTNMGSLDFTEMGLNGSWHPLSQLQMSMQVVYRRAGKTDNQNVRLDFGFLDYSFIADAESLFGIRGGRVFNPYGLYNDTRDMPFTRPSIFLPQSVYFDVDRNFSLSGDGVQIYGERRTDFGDFSLQINGMYPRTDDPELNNTIVGGGPGYMTGELSWMGRLSYEADNGKIKLAVTSAEINSHYVSRAGGAHLCNDVPGVLCPGQFQFSPTLFSARYLGGNWGLEAEYALRPTSLKNFGPSLPDTHFTGESYYIQGHYRFAPKWEALMRYDVLYADRNDRGGQATAAGAAAAGVVLNAYNNFAKDITFGLRYDVTPWWMLRAEYHLINGTGWTSNIENKDQANTEQHWNMFAFSTSFRF